MKSLLTTEETEAIENLLKECHLPQGLGTGPHEACSMAAINLALTGELTDDIPDCMSLVIGHWIIYVQDRMPDAVRNSPQWKALLPLAAGTGRACEVNRFKVCMDWMWDALAMVQPFANKTGFGKEWSDMIKRRTSMSISLAKIAATDAGRTSNKDHDDTMAYFHATSAAVSAYAAISGIPASAAAAAASASAAAVRASGDPEHISVIESWVKIDPVSALRNMISMDTPDVPPLDLSTREKIEEVMLSDRKLTIDDAKAIQDALARLLRAEGKQ